MMLGNLISRLSDESTIYELLVAHTSLTLVARMRERAEECGLEFSRYAADAAKRYAVEAGDDEWLTLMGTMTRADDPSAVYLSRAFSYALERGDTEVFDEPAP